MRAARLAGALMLTALLGGCFEPLYGVHPASPQSETIRDKLASVEIPTINAPLNSITGAPTTRLAVGLHNALEYDLNNAAGPSAPTHRLVVTIAPTNWVMAIEPVTGRPTADIGGLIAYYSLVEIATGKVVVKDSTYAHVDFDVPGPEQRFAKQRAQRNAEDRAMQVAAETIRNRLASYFVAGT